MVFLTIYMPSPSTLQSRPASIPYLGSINVLIATRLVVISDTVVLKSSIIFDN